jgi:hypothetical protein
MDCVKRDRNTSRGGSVFLEIDQEPENGAEERRELEPDLIVEHYAESVFAHFRKFGREESPDQ